MYRAHCQNFELYSNRNRTKVFLSENTEHIHKAESKINYALASELKKKQKKHWTNNQNE